MTPKVKIPNLLDLGRRYLAGELMNELSCEAGVHIETFRKALISAGVYQSRKGPRISSQRIKVPYSVIRRYLAGESENSIANSLNVSRGCIRIFLLKNGVVPRNQSQAESLKWGMLTTAQRGNQTAAAHIAARGRIATIEERARRAITEQTMLNHTVPAEYLLASLLFNKGIETIQQKAVGIYNIDVAIETPPIAVEIFGGNWHTSKAHFVRHLERSKYLLDCGWNIVIAWVDAVQYPLDIGCANYIVALVQELRGDPSLSRQYRVILGNGQTASIRRTHLNTSAIIETIGGGVNISGG